MKIQTVGETTLSYSGYPSVDHISLFGIFINGTLTMNGTAKLNISITHTGDTLNAFSGGIHAKGDISIASGIYSIHTTSKITGYGIESDGGGIAVSGGTLEIDALGKVSAAICSMYGEFYMSGGRITGTAKVHSTESQPAALVAQFLTLEGGEASFITETGTDAAGCIFMKGGISYTGGHFIFSGSSAGLSYFGHGDPYYSLTGGNVLVSLYANGSVKSLWTSDADGILIKTHPEYSDFLYVELGGDLSDVTVAAVTVDIPKTGDSAKPRLWTGIRILCVLCAAGLIVRRKRARTC